MNNIKNHITIFSHRSYRNFIIINTIIIIAFFFILLVNKYCEKEVNNLLNSEINRTVTVFINDNNKDIVEILNKQQKYVANIIYELHISNQKIGDKTFELYSINNITNEEEFVILVGNYFSETLVSILGVTINNIQYADDVDSNIIYCNQYLSNHLFETTDLMGGSLTFEVLNHKDLPKIVSIFTSHDIEAVQDSSMSETIETYNKIINLVQTLNYLLIFLLIIVTIILCMNILYEQKRNIKIYDMVGYNYYRIQKNYLRVIYKVLFKIYSIISILIIIILLILDFIFHKNMLVIYIKIFYIPLFILIFINSLVLMTGIIIIIKKERERI